MGESGDSSHPPLHPSIYSSIGAQQLRAGLVSSPPGAPVHPSTYPTPTFVSSFTLLSPRPTPSKIRANMNGPTPPKISSRQHPTFLFQAAAVMAVAIDCTSRFGGAIIDGFPMRRGGGWAHPSERLGFRRRRRTDDGRHIIHVLQKKLIECRHLVRSKKRQYGHSMSADCLQAGPRSLLRQIGKRSSHEEQTGDTPA